MHLTKQQFGPKKQPHGQPPQSISLELLWNSVQLLCLWENGQILQGHDLDSATTLQRFGFTILSRQTFDILDTGTLRPKSGVLCSIWITRNKFMTMFKTQLCFRNSSQYYRAVLKCFPSHSKDSPGKTLSATLNRSDNMMMIIKRIINNSKHLWANCC